MSQPENVEQTGSLESMAASLLSHRDPEPTGGKQGVLETF